MATSMTGFAAHTLSLHGANLHMELRSVNSRYLDLHFRLPDELRQFEPAIRDCLSARILRGKVECRLLLRAEKTVENTQHSLNLAQVEALMQLQHSIQTHAPQAAPLSIHEILRWPGILQEAQLSPETLQTPILTLCAAVRDELTDNRRREGNKLATLIHERADRMLTLVDAIQPRIPQLVSEHHERIAHKLREACQSLDEERLRQEITLFAQRIDVDEELSRLVTHLHEVKRILTTDGAIGKRLDFLMQELNREANTLASKATASDVSDTAVELKVLIEQMREQIQNIE